MFKNPEGKKIWLENVMAIPSYNYDEAFLKPTKVDKSIQFAKECGSNNFYIAPEEEGFCRSAIISASSEFNGGALDCNCNSQGSYHTVCNKIGGQCPCKDNVIGRQCTRCKPGFFGFPECKQCKCPPTAQCNEETGECICAPRVTGTPENPCSQCEANTFGYDPITGCQDCMCQYTGTNNGNMSCSLETGNCFCKENIEGRTCDHCTPGYYGYPYCDQCPCYLPGTTQDICNQQTSTCLCKTNIEGNLCDTCKPGSFNLDELNPDGCTECFCFGKASFCSSKPNMKRKVISIMNNWLPSSVIIGKETIEESELSNDDYLTNYGNELIVDSLIDYGIDLKTSTLYFKSPLSFSGNQIKSYSGKLRYSITYSGYDFDDVPRSPDAIIQGKDFYLVHYSGVKISPNEPTKMEIPIEPRFWDLPKGIPSERSMLMAALKDVQAIYIKGSYGSTIDGQIRVKNITLDSAEESSETIEEGNMVTGIEKCECPEGYFGDSCEDCDVGYYRVSEGPFGPICVPCNCHGHADTCHPVTGECVNLTPEESHEAQALEALPHICHFQPDLCRVSNETCLHNTRGKNCEECDVGYFGDARRGSHHDCQPCPCPLQDNNFAISCDGILNNPQDSNYCVCKPNYVGERCQFCGPGYYGEPEVQGDYCKLCQCNENIDANDPDACDRFSGICQKCLNHSYGDDCSICEPWFFGDAVDVKNCASCECNKQGTERCDDKNGECKCLPGVEGVLCDECMSEHWGFKSANHMGCLACDCSDASYESQCEEETGQCKCKPGVTGQKCDRCQHGYWNLGSEGCENCGCNTEFAVGGTCDQETGQCECLEGVIGQNCDHCPAHWVLIVNETRTEIPDWKRPFTYREGCFPCSSCISDLLHQTESLNSSLAPTMKEFLGVESSFFAYKKLNYIQDEMLRLQPEIELLNPAEGSRRLEPLEKTLSDHESMAKSLNIDYKESIMNNLKEEANELEKLALNSGELIDNTRIDIDTVTMDMQKIAEGLGSGVTPEQLESAVLIAMQWVDSMKLLNFSNERQMAIEEQIVARDLVKEVNNFIAPLKQLKMDVNATKSSIQNLWYKLEDLKNNSINASDKLKKAEQLNFRNSDPPASNKRLTILKLEENAKSMNEMGSDLIKESDLFLAKARDNLIDTLPQENTKLQDMHIELSSNLEQARNVIEDNNMNAIRNAEQHAYNLQNQANGLQNIIDKVKTPGNRTLEATNAYEKIVESVKVATEKSETASTDANDAARMSKGVGKKAAQSKDRTQELYNSAKESESVISEELSPWLEHSKKTVEEANEKTKATKQILESASRALDILPSLTDQLERSASDANEAETHSNDALASIHARADEISQDMANAKNLHRDYSEMKYSLDATKKVLEDLEKRRSRRDADNDGGNVVSRIEKLIEAGNRISSLTVNASGMLKSLKDRVKNVRFNLKKIGRPGVTFQQSSYLELKTPENINSEALNTKVSLYFNVTKRSDGDERAFIFYMGNVIDTHTKMPRATTDDFMAVEVVNGGAIKTTIDMGAGEIEILSASTIDYGEWHHLELERLEHTITMTLKKDRSGAIDEDIIRSSLPLVDKFKRPFGSVFNLHPKYSKIFVGGFPNHAGIQDAVRETFMEGQIENLKIGNQDIGLWNYVDARNIRGARQRNRFKIKPSQGLKFEGNSYVAISKYDFVSLDSEFDITLSFKLSSSNGIILLMGSVSDGDFVCLEVMNGNIVYSFNLGDGVDKTISPEKYDLEVWHSAILARNGNVGTLSINGEAIGDIQSPGASNQLSIDDFIYLGGFPGYIPFSAVMTTNFTGCIKDVFIGVDRADLASSPEKYNVKPGCTEEKLEVASFLSSNPGYMQLKEMTLQDRIHVSFMFRTNQAKGLLLYMQDVDMFYYVSLSFSEGALSLRVFPRFEIETSDKGSRKPISYDDNEWHTVYISVMKTGIIMHIDDYEVFNISIENESEVPLLDKRYNVFFGGIPDSSSPMPGSIANNAPFIGCIRDVVMDNNLYHFNDLEFHTGMLLGECVIESAPSKIVETEKVEPETDEIIKEKSTATLDNASTDLNENEDDEEDEAGMDSDMDWGFKESIPEEPPQTFGECALPISSSIDTNLTIRSGMRFGTKKESYLEFNRKLKIKKRSEFKIDLRTTKENGVILYTANERNIDFIALFMKKGKIVYGFNCGSGSTYIQTNDMFNDGRWHHVEFKRHGNRGKLYVNGLLMGEKISEGDTQNLDVIPELFLGGIKQELREELPVQRNLMRVTTGFVGCLREFIHRRKRIGKWSKNNSNGVIACSDMVEQGSFFGSKGGHILVQPRYRVGMDFDINMDIKPRNISGILLAIQGRKDYLILQMIDGAIQFTADNGRGPIFSSFKPKTTFSLCDGKWHRIQGTNINLSINYVINIIISLPNF
uniref:Laminin subunit alphalike [Acyrthosiphon pisum] n=1 Tax=Lepeophtheirus salmonis TaxID=72036 RepID=A0A0K2UE20_LEPSM